MYREYGKTKFRGMDSVTKSDVKFLRDLANYVESQVNEEQRYIYQNNDSFQEYLKKDIQRLSYSITSNISSNKATINKLKALKVLYKVDSIGEMLDMVVNNYIDELSLRNKEKYCKLIKVYEAEVEEKYHDKC